MKDVLYRYCVGNLDDEVPNDKIWNDCSRIFLVDGQKLDIAESLNAIRIDYYDKDKPLANQELVKRNQDAGNDSINFQQLRAYTLASQISTMVNDSGLKIAIIGGGFSGFTCASVLLDKCTESKVTLFEHYSHPLPRFFRSFGRYVYPFHHIRQPNDQLETAVDGTPFWPCPIQGGKEAEKGGIPKHIDWMPGNVVEIIEGLGTKTSERLKKEYKNRFEFCSLKKVFNISEKNIVDNIFKLSLNLQGLSAPERRDTSDQEIDQPYQFDVVIIAAGGLRNHQGILGQSNQEYWVPQFVENLPPSTRAHQIAVLGNGNSAASEVYNYAIKDRSFVTFLAALQAAAKSNKALEKLMASNYSNPKTLQQFSDLLEDKEWDKALSDAVFNEHIYNKQDIFVSLVVRKSLEDLNFKDMNPINRFLIHLLFKLGVIGVLSIDKKDADESHYKIEGLGYKKTLRAFRSIGGAAAVWTDLNPAEGSVTWTLILNCLKPERNYHKLFNVSDKQPYRILKPSGLERSYSLSKLLAEKAQMHSEAAA